jgi:hypothetical protein
MVTTSAPTRSQISLSSSPNRPITATSTFWPGATRDTRAASMAAREVPSTRKVC